MMGVNTFIEHALKMQESSFTLKDFSKFLTEMGIPCPKKELRAVLEQSPEVFQLDNGLYITKAGFFSGRLFSICPTAQEYDAGVLVPGDRCMPFVDSELYTSKLQFVIDGTTLPYKQASFDSDTAIDMFMFYGEEYAPQYIADDEANAGCREILLSEGLSNNVSLTGIDISLLKEKYNLKRGGRLLCKVLSRWDGVVEVCVEGDGENRFDLGENGEKRLFWYEVLENAFLEAFEAEGPCECIEAQIVSVFYHNVDALCVPECGSLEEFINRYAKKSV